MLAEVMADDPIRVCVVTAARSEYGLLRWPMQELADDARFQLQVVAAAAHLDETYDFTFREIEADGFTIDATVPAAFGSRSERDLASAVGGMTTGFADAFEALKPHLVLVSGDRYELLAVCSACVLMTIPIAHISGGEVTEGAIDEQVRHAVTKMAHLHFVANETYAGRVRQMGEETWRVCVSGEPGLDNLRRLTLMPADEVDREIGMDMSRATALVTYHPATLEGISVEAQMNTLLAALEQGGMQYVLTYPNADAGSNIVIEALENFRDRYAGGAVLFKNLGQRRYLSTLKHVTMMIGNASSGIFEAPSFNVPVVNVGDRQRGRVRAANIIDVGCDTASILEGIETALAYHRGTECVNAYGDGRSAPRIRDFIAETFSARPRQEILRKRFVEHAA